MDSAHIVANKWKPWLICLSAALFFYYVFFQLAMFNTIGSDLMKSYQLNSTQLGYLSSSYFFADALFIIPAGILLDRFSTRRIALIVMAACVLATFGFALSKSFTLAFICRAVVGAGNAFAFLTSMQLASRWLPSKRLALGIGLIITIIMLGGIIAQTPLTLLVSKINWRNAMLINACLGALFFFFMFFMIRDYPKDQIPKTSSTETKTLFSNLKIAMKNKQNWFCASFTALLNLPIALLGELWGVMYLVQAHHLSKAIAANITSMMFVGMIIGSPAVGWFSDKLQLRRIPMLLANSLILFTVILIIYAPVDSTFMLGSLFFLLGLLASAQVISYPTIAESNSLAVTGTAMSIVAILLNLVSFAAQPLFGWLMHWHSILHNVSPITNHYSISDFYVAMALLPIAFLLSLLAALFVRETYCKPYHEAKEKPMNDDTEIHFNQQIL